jgi:division/cell wall cluster transcriptional repressor MraZ
VLIRLSFVLARLDHESLDFSTSDHERMETEQPSPPQSPVQPPAVIRYGNYETTIDLKRRLVLPVEVRNGMDPERDGSSFFVFLGKHKRIWFYPKRPYIQLVSRARVGLTPKDEDLDFYQALVGNAYELEWDKQGRVIVPEKLLRRAELSLPAEVTLVGTVEHYQLWPRAEWDKNSDRLDEHLESIVNRARDSGLTL